MFHGDFAAPSTGKALPTEAPHFGVRFCIAVTIVAALTGSAGCAAHRAAQCTQANVDAAGLGTAVCLMMETQSAPATSEQEVFSRIFSPRQEGTAPFILPNPGTVILNDRGVPIGQTDPWGNPYHLTIVQDWNGRQGVVVRSFGENGYDDEFMHDDVVAIRWSNVVCLPRALPPMDAHGNPAE